MASSTLNTPSLKRKAVAPTHQTTAIRHDVTPLTIHNDITVLFLTQGKRALIDTADWQAVSAHPWCYDSGTGYAVARINNKKTYLHRFLMPPGVLEVDHRKNNKLDCRRNSMRSATRAENSRNMSKRRGKTSRFKGVCWSKKDQAWDVAITVDYITYHLAVCTDEHYAGLVYDEAARFHFGTFAKTNFPGTAAASIKELRQRHGITTLKHAGPLLDPVRA